MTNFFIKILKPKIKLLTFLRRIRGFLSYYLKGLYERFNSHHAFLIGGGLSFSIFTCILPLVLIIFALLGILLERPAIKEQIDIYINTFIPYQESAHYYREIIFSRINDFRIFKNVYGSLGIIGLFFAASGLFGSLRTILNNIFKVEKARNIIIQKLIDFGMVLVVILFVLFSSILLPSLDIFLNLSGKIRFEKLLEYKLIGNIFSSLISMSIIFLMMYAIYFLIPFERPGRKVAAVSAFWTAFLWEIAKKLFGIYIANSITLSRVYGAYLFVVIAFFWIYYSSLVFIAGAEIGQLFREKQQRYN